MTLAGLGSRLHRAVDLEYAADLGELAGLILQAARGGSGFFHKRGVLLGVAVHGAHRFADLLDVAALRLAGLIDLAHDARDLSHAAHDLFHGRACLIDQSGADLYLIDRVADKCLDLLGGVGRALREVAHLGGDDCKAAALFASARRFDRRVEREDVGLEGDPVNDADDVDDLARGLVDRAHCLHDLGDDFATFFGHCAGRRGKAVGFLAVLCVLANGVAQLFDGARALVERGSLFFGAAGKILVADSDLLGAVIDGVYGDLDVVDDAR